MKITLLSKHVVIETAPPETPDPDFSFPAGEDRTTKGVVRNVARDLDIKVKVGDTVLFRNRMTSDYTSNDTRYALVASSDIFAVVEQDRPEGDEADGDERVVAHANPYRATGHDRPEADLKDLPTPDPSDEDTRPETDKGAEVSHPVANPARSTAADRVTHHDDAKDKAADKGKDAEAHAKDKAPAHKTDKADHDDAKDKAKHADDKAKPAHGHGKAH